MAKMVAQTRLNVMVHVHCPFRFVQLTAHDKSYVANNSVNGQLKILVKMR